ncbi:heat shock protein DnaJ domain protein [Thermocrinis albus DSM 14484]|uniref:Heat shock protein DnaJ domain protein n=1 Tax=Thermocrinis albus (strain DSM 14484 / JCM 11386 / HI 11/12) TaxID=638303 RepID=D3SPR1_THEAH|nr:J domain-containing protein [Thermocrinis albus]ADC89148.1 heat shock protein DnaJ domain protein [Thermocrinis albus DSM 14484]
MRNFYIKVLDYLLEKRLEAFQAHFFQLNRNFGDNVDRFIRVWFEGYILKRLIQHFPLSDIVEHYPSYMRRKRQLIRSYVATYWSFCKRPYRFPTKVTESLRFFGLDTLDEAKLRKAYRQMVLKYHPDRYGNREEAHRRMVLINYHYQVLLSYLSRLRNDPV